MIQNPVFRKELLVRFRLRQGASAQLGVLIAILAGIGLFHWYFIKGMLDERSMTGRDAFLWMVVMQYAIICLMTPAIAANAITQEREQQTWEMLIFTRLNPSEIIWGKLLGRMMPTFGLLAICLPLTVLCVVVSYIGRDGGWRGYSAAFYNQEVVSTGELLGVYVVMLVTSLFYTTLGLYLSYRTRRTLYALMGSYTVVIGGLLIGTLLLTSMLQQFVRDYRFSEQFPLLWVNPAYMMMQVLSPVRPYGEIYLVGGLFVYLVATAFMLWHMITGFRRFATE